MSLRSEWTGFESLRTVVWGIFSELIETWRSWIANQGGTIKDLVIVSGQVTIDLQESNYYRLVMTEDAQIQDAVNDHCTSAFIYCIQDPTGGWEMTWTAEWTVVGDKHPTAADAPYCVNVMTDGAGRKIANILDESL